MQTKLVVLGGGPGGYAAAFLAADLGMQVTLVDAEPNLGGVCLLRGCIPSKALLHVAKVVNEAAHMEGWGVRFEQPQIDINAMRQKKEKVISTLAGGLKQLAKARKVKVLQARGTFENSNTLKLEATGDAKLEDNKLQFEHCIVATGSRPTRVPSLNLDTPRVMDSTGALELPELPESLLVIGGGYIGLEMGTVYAALGSKVTVVEMLEGILPGADRDLVKPLERKLKQEFAAIYTNTKVASMEDKGEAIEVHFDGEADPATQRFSHVLVSIGRKPNSDNLGLDQTKVEIDDRGFIKVNKQQRTKDPHILAIGDVAGEPMLAHKAAHEGKVAVEALHGEAVEFSPRAIPAVVFTDPEIAWAGLTEREAQEKKQKVEVAVFPWQASGRAQAVGATGGLTKWLVDPETERVLGVGIAGPGAGDLVSEACLAIEMGATVRDVGETIHPHPTLSETISGASEVYLGTATDFYRPKKKK